MNLPFQYIQMLWLLLLIPALAAVYFYALNKKKKTFKKMGDAALVKELTSSYNTSSFSKKFALLIIAMLLILLSIANLRSDKGSQQVNRNGIDVMIALDVSKSMLAQDIKPNRLDRSKQLLNKLMDRLSNDRIGLVVFAGKSYLQMPLTGDHSAAKMYLSAATPETVPTQGTVIGDALKMCYASFNAKEKKYKAVVLISDGEDHDENAVKIAGQMAQEGVVINTVGIGSPEGAPIMDETTNELKKDNEGNTVITKLNEQELMEVAKSGNGSYQLFTSTDAAVSALYDGLSTLDKRNVKDDSLINYKSLFQYLLAAALLFLIIELLISEVRKIAPRKLKTAAATLVLLCFVINASAQSDNVTIKKGNDEYKKGQYETAAKSYDEAAKKNANDPTAQYNLGNALYKSKNAGGAVDAYDKAEKVMVKPAEKSNALYNKGVVLQKDKKLENCIQVYKESLKQDPSNADARHNLEIALKQQKQDQQKQDQQQKNQNDKKNQDQQKQPQQKENKMSQKDAEQKLQALMDKEKDLQDKVHKVGAASPDKPEKDW